MTMLFHVSGWKELRTARVGDEFLLRPGEQHAEGEGVYFAEGKPRWSAAEGARGGPSAAVVIDADFDQQLWWRTKAGTAKKHGRPRTWRTLNAPIHVRIYDVVDVSGVPFLLCEGTPGRENPSDEEITLEDFLDGSESIPDDEVEGFLTARGLVPIEVVFANGDRVLLIDFDGDRYVLESDGASFDAKRAEEWLSSKLMHNVGDMVEAEELPDFWRYPPQLYHATQRENYGEIMAKGLGARSRSRVGSNRWVGSSVFTSTDPEAIDAYGDLIFEIDTAGMARDGVTPQVGLEPGIFEDMQARALAAKIGLYEYEPGVLESGEGLAESTVIIFGHIPPKYLSTPFE